MEKFCIIESNNASRKKTQVNSLKNVAKMTKATTVEGRMP